MPNFSTSLFEDFKIGDFFYGTNHPMKPFRLIMLQDLIWSYGIQNFLHLKYPRKIFIEKMRNFHGMLFFEKLKSKKGFFEKKFNKNLENFFPTSFQNDCPVLRGLTDYCERYSGASLSASADISQKNIQNSVNWGGGLHHGKSDFFSGFCYVNDIVLSILELLKTNEKVLYVDIDVHHGDGVEEAFYLSHRVFTVSFHQFGKFFFPETGNISNKGYGSGKNFSVNVPLKEGLSDKAFEFISKPILSKIVENFKPNVIVLQGGADSLSGDKLGKFNLSLEGHSSCLRFLKGLNIPLLVLGGGGYTPANVARCWTFETSILIKKDISFDIPYNNHWEHFFPSKKLVCNISDKKDKNSRQSLIRLRERILNNIKTLNTV